MSDERIILISDPERYGYDQLHASDVHEEMMAGWPVDFGLLAGSTVEARVNLCGFCAGTAPPSSPLVRLRVGGTDRDPTEHAYVSEALQGALVAEFDCSAGYHSGSSYLGSSTEAGQSNAVRLGGVYTFARPLGLAMLRASIFTSAAESLTGYVGLTVQLRGLA